MIMQFIVGAAALLVGWVSWILIYAAMTIVLVPIYQRIEGDEHLGRGCTLLFIIALFMVYALVVGDITMTSLGLRG